jgi:hypothetical protein
LEGKKISNVCCLWSSKRKKRGERRGRKKKTKEIPQLHQGPKNSFIIFVAFHLFFDCFHNVVLCAGEVEFDHFGDVQFGNSHIEKHESHVEQRAAEEEFFVLDIVQRSFFLGGSPLRPPLLFLDSMDTIPQQHLNLTFSPSLFFMK